MSTATASTALRFTRDQFGRMIAARVFAPGQRVELIKGALIAMPPIGPRHAAAVDRLTRLFTREFGDAAIVRVQGPVPLDVDTERYPDLALLRPCPDFYRTTPLTPADILSAVEVGDTSVTRDRREKIPLYAAAGIPEAWLLDVDALRLEVFRDPRPSGYRQHDVRDRSAFITVAAFPHQPLAGPDVLGDD